MRRFLIPLILTFLSLSASGFDGSASNASSCAKIDRASIVFPGDTSIEFAVVGMSDSVRVEYGLSGFTQGTGTFLTTHRDTIVIAGLSAATAYDFYFENNCKGSGNGVSQWSSAFTFETSQKVSLPYLNNFNQSLGDFTSTYFSNTTSPTTPKLKWERTNQVLVYSIPAGFLHANGTTFAGLQSLSSQTYLTTYREAVLMSPILDTSGMKEQMIVELGQHGGQLAAIEVYDGFKWVGLSALHNGSPATSLVGLGYGTTGQGIPSHKIYDVAAYANPNLMIRWKAVNPYTLGEPFIVIDDFSVRHVDCVESLDFRVEDAGPDWVHLEWEGVTATGFKIEYGPNGFTPGTGTVLYTSNNTVSINNLTPNTNYKFLLTDSCANGAWLTQSSSTNFFTAGGLVNGVFLADFQSYWNGFTLLDNTPLSTGWQRIGGRASVADPDWYTGLSSNEYLIAPPVGVGSKPAGGGVRIEYDIMQSSIVGLQNSVIYLEMYDGSSWQSIRSYQGPHFTTPSGGTAQLPIREDVTITNINQAVARFRFRFHAQHTPSTSNPWVIDNVRISGNCGGSGIVSYDTTQVWRDRVALNWISSGSLTNISWGPSGYDPYISGSVRRGIVGNHDTITDLRMNTCYDVYIADSCSGFISGRWIGPLSFCTDSSLCPTPSQLQLNYVGTDSAYFSWTSSGGLLNSTLEYGPSGFGRGSGTVFYTSGGHAGIGSLSSLTAYDVYIEDSCMNDLSDWIKLSFTTLDTPLVAPFSQNFDSVPTPPAANGTYHFSTQTDYFPRGWLNYSPTGKFWKIRYQIDGGPMADHTTGSGKYAAIPDGKSPNSQGILMTTPLIDVSTLSWPSLQFYHWGAGDFSDNHLYVDLWNGQKWFTDIFTDTLGTNRNWQEAWVDLAAYPIVGNIMVRFRVDEDFSYPNPRNSIAIDDILIDEMQICPQPVTPLYIMKFCDTISLVYNDHQHIDTMLVEYGLSGFMPGSGISFQPLDPDTLSFGGLLRSTKYDFYMANICNGDTSSYLGPITVTTDQDSSMATFTHNVNSPYGLTFTSTGHRPGDNLQWDFGDGNTDTGAVVTHSYSVGGAYTVRLIVSNECQTDTALLLLANVGIEEDLRRGNTIKVYPNPASDEINVEVVLGDRIGGVLEIIDVNGRRVASRKFVPTGRLKEKMSIGLLAKGVYTLRVNTAVGVSSAKFSVE